VFHDGLNILFVADMHKTACRQTVFDDDIKENLDGGGTMCSSDIGDSTTGHTSK
jgi:hypothetical protein